MHKILSILFGLVTLCGLAQNPNHKIYMRYGDGKSNTLIVTNGAYFASADDLYTVTTNMADVYMPKSGGTFSGHVTVDNSFSSGSGTEASGDYSHAEGTYTRASGYASHADGNSTIASGDFSHAEGNYTIASGDFSHADGNSTIASGDFSHAEGYSTTSSGDASHAEGTYTIASGDFSHAEGIKSLATNNTSFVWQGVQGEPWVDYDPYSVPGYCSHGDGTFNINPAGGTSGVWIGNTTLYSIIYESEIVKSKTSSGEPLHNVFVIKDLSDNSFSLVEITQ